MTDKKIAMDVSKIGISVEGYGVINSKNLKNFMSNEQVMLKLAGSLFGPSLIAHTMQPQLSGDVDLVHSCLFDVIKYESVALKLTETMEGISLLAETEWNGSSALNRAVRLHKKVALNIIETEEGRNILANTKDSTGFSVLHTSVRWHESVALRLLEIPGGKELLEKTKADLIKKSALDLAISTHQSVRPKISENLKRS